MGLPTAPHILWVAVACVPEVQSKSWLDPRIDVTPSHIHGQGLFAVAAIRRGEEIIRWGGQVRPVAQLQHLKRRGRYDCAALTEETIIVFADDDPVVYGNHSCDPNLWMASQVTWSARRDIRNGEEITVDYATLSDDAGWIMACTCGCAMCRRFIRGDDWKLPNLRARYRSHFTPYLTGRLAEVGK
jgi:SET domain-containing protein